MKEKCNCGLVATWCYMPASNSMDNPYFCDNHVPRGCSCNREYVPRDDDSEKELGYPGENPPTGNEWKWVEKDVSWEYTDNKGRSLPCCEFWYEQNGWDYGVDEDKL